MAAVRLTSGSEPYISGTYTHAGIFVLPDGVPGKRTSDAFRAVTGSFLPGDPRRG